MDSLTLQWKNASGSGATGGDSRIRAFRATDAFVVEAYRLASVFEGGAGRDLARDLRRTVARCGASLVAASVAGPGGELEVGAFRAATRALAEGRYYLYLARRFGLIDVTRYRAVIARQDTAARELESVLQGDAAPGGRHPT